MCCLLCFEVLMRVLQSLVRYPMQHCFCAATAEQEQWLYFGKQSSPVAHH